MFLISARQLTTATRTFSSRQLTSAAASSSEKLTENFSIEVTQDGIAMITLDMPGAPVNTLQSSLSAEFPTVLSRIESDSTIKAAVLRSGKPGVWVAGADINELAACNTAADAQKLSADGQAGLATIEACSKPIVAAINGACLGGGLELAMACHYRVASTDSKCKLGLPEVQLGLLPGAGGTQRLQKLIGIQEALKMTTMGRQDKADKAKRTGLVDVVADPNALDHAAHLCALQLADGTLKRSKGKKKNMMGRALEDNPVGRKVLFQQARKAAVKASGGNYPAIPLIIDCIEKGAESGMSAGLKLEAENFGKLTQTNESAALIGLFHGTTATKKNPYGKPKSPAKTVGVLGAGLMGAGIGQVSATRGHKVLLKDINASAVARGLKQVEDSLNTRVKRRRMSVFDRDNIVAKITGLDNDGNWKDHFAKCDLVIEAVLEEMHIKHAVVKEFEAVLPKHAVIASNTSGLKVKDIASVSARPENIVGMHYFSPVDKMQLLEVVRTDQTSDEAAAIAVDAGLKQGKFVIVTKDVSGFYVNRCIGPMMVEVNACLQEGIGLAEMDKAMKKFGFPVGPIQLGDEVGIDVAAHLVPNLEGELGIRVGGATMEAYDDLVAQGFLGKKNNKGFYKYDKKGKRQGINPEAEALLKKYVTPQADGKKKPSGEEAALRCGTRFALEAAWCMNDEVIRNAVDGDIGAVFGVGFPPFLGGPFRWMDSVGIKEFVARLDAYKAEFGGQWEAPPILREMAKNGTTWH